MKGNNKGRQSLLAHFTQEHDFQQQQLFSPVQSNYLAQKQQQLAIQRQQQLATQKDFYGGKLFCS